MIEAMLQALLYLACVGLGSIAALKDIDTDFKCLLKGRRFSLILVLKHMGTIAFLLANGLLSGGFLAWALNTDKGSVINQIIQVESHWGKMVVIGLGVPLLVRSKWFSFSESPQGERSFGPAGIYDWLRLRVLIGLSTLAGLEKDRLAKEHALRLSASPNLSKNFPGQLQQFVVDAVSPFMTPGEKTDMESEFTSIQNQYSSNLLSQDHLRMLIRWAMDYAGISPIDRWLKNQG